MPDLMRWSPFDEMATMWPRELSSFPKRDGGLGVEWRPRCDVTDSDGQILIHAELPGVDKDNIEVSLDRGVLTIRGEKREERNEEKEGQTHRERFFGSFERRIAVGEDVDPAKIAATIKDGVLEVRLPKTKPAKPGAHRIPVQAN
jgi:HSP20 family protein